MENRCARYRGHTINIEKQILAQETTCKMEMDTVEGSETTQIGANEASENSMDTDKFSEDTSESISEVNKESGEAEPVVNGISNLADKAADFDNLDLPQQITVNLETESMHGKEKEEKNALLEEMLNKALNERGDTLKEQERLRVFELECTRFTMELSESAPEVFQFKEDANLPEKLEDITKYTLALRQKEMTLQEQLADAELRRKELEDKLNLESDLLQQEIKVRSLKEDKLNGAQSMLSKLEVKLEVLKEKVLDLEGQMKLSMVKSEEYKELARQSEEDCVESFRRVVELDNLCLISESRTKEIEQIVTALQNEISGLQQKHSDNEQTQETLNVTETKLFKVEELLKHSNDDLKHAEMPDDYLLRIKDLETALLASRQKEQELQEVLLVAQDKISSFEDMEMNSTYRLFEVENLAEVFRGISNDAQEKIDALEQDLKIASETEIQLGTKLKELEEKLSMQDGTIQLSTTRGMELEQLLESQANDAEIKLQATKENYACTDSEAKRLSEKNLLIACVKESDYQASQASISALAMGLELQVLHGKLSEMKIVLQDLEGKFMAEKSRADIAEAGSVALAKENSKLNDEVARLQVHMDEIQKCLDEVQREKLSAADLVTSTTKNINSLTEQLVNERQRLHKQISSLVKDNHDLTMKYSETKNKLQDLSSKHGNDPMKEIKREEIFKGNLEDLKVRLDESTGVDVHSTDLNQMLHLGEKELQEQDMVSENLLLRGGPRSLGDFEESLSSSYLKDMKTKSVSECQPVPVSDLGTVVNVKFSRPIIPDIKIMLVVVAVSVIIGLVIGRNY